MENQISQTGQDWKAARMSAYKMRPAEEINQALDNLPVAEEFDLKGVQRNDEGQAMYEEEVPNFKGIRVTDSFGNKQYVYMPSKKYNVVQHKDAFRPIVEGMMQAGIHDFGFITISDAKKAQLQLYATGKGYDSVSLGFNVINSFDGSSAINYGFRSFREQSYIEVVGYREACANGMKIRVPLEQAEIIRPELRSQVQELLKEHSKIMHTKSATQRIELMQYIVEAISLLREPVENMIKKAQKWHWEDEERLKDLIKTHVGQRYKAKVEEHLGQYSQDLWGLYNAITHVASHDSELKETARETLLEKGANMLMQEL